jgi:hypothetical protein
VLDWPSLGAVYVHDVSTPFEAAATAKAATMLAIAEYVGVDLDEMNDVRRRLAEHEAMFEATLASSRRAELAKLVALDVAELADAFKRMKRAVERGGDA